MRFPGDTQIRCALHGLNLAPHTLGGERMQPADARNPADRLANQDILLGIFFKSDLAFDPYISTT